MLIDIHTHCARQRLPGLARPNGSRYPTPERLLEMLDEAGIDRAVVVSGVSPEKRYTVVTPEETLRQIARNAGVDGSIVVQRIKENDGAFGFNAQTEEYGDLIEAGIIDPTKVVRHALQNAASVASLMITTEALVADKPEKANASAGGPPGGGGMPDYDF